MLLSRESFNLDGFCITVKTLDGQEIRLRVTENTTVLWIMKALATRVNLAKLGVEDFNESDYLPVVRQRIIHKGQQIGNCGNSDADPLRTMKMLGISPKTLKDADPSKRFFYLVPKLS